MNALQIVLLVGGILLFNVILWTVLLLWLKRRMEKASAELRAELENSGEHLERGPESAVYRGATAEFPNVKGNGMMALTDKRILFRRAVGSPIDVPRDRITGVREDKWFNRSYRNGQLHLIVQLEGGTEVGFMVSDHAAWMSTLAPASLS